MLVKATFLYVYKMPIVSHGSFCGVYSMCLQNVDIKEQMSAICRTHIYAILDSLKTVCVYTSKVIIIIIIILIIIYIQLYA